MNICTKCKHHKHIIHNPAAPNVWYNHFCSASLLEEVVDPITGETGYLDYNDLGNRVIKDTPYNYCRDVNTNGFCTMFRPDLSLK